MCWRISDKRKTISRKRDQDALMIKTSVLLVGLITEMDLSMVKWAYIPRDLIISSFNGEVCVKLRFASIDWLVWSNSSERVISQIAHKRRIPWMQFNKDDYRLAHFKSLKLFHFIFCRIEHIIGQTKWVHSKPASFLYFSLHYSIILVLTL